MYNENGDNKSSGDILEQLIGNRKNCNVMIIDKMPKGKLMFIMFIMLRIRKEYTFTFQTDITVFLIRNVRGGGGGYKKLL